ncbi:SWIM zinc finger family protein [Ruminococcus albus]|uniref:SWIM-type domain-containing protein n=1 Tax=Ruminococcus albus TaxID=1264 RepID=A0A1H7MCF4_RUMAL|nr:SWIM zinc finger family protein [Ruminococcus albus]SEL08976.1 hypothetical protein SAMN05216469_11180 [Ruminococcus albus]
MTDAVKEIRKLIASADEDTLVSLANKGTYKRACKDAEGAPADFTENDDSIVLDFGGETVTIKSPLDKSTCTCPSRAVCRHIVGALVVMKGVIPADEAAAPEPEQETPAAENTAEEISAESAEVPADEPVPTEPETVYLSEKDTAKVRACSELCRGLLADILADGLVRTPADMPARIEAAAVRCHSVKAAAAEKIMREIGGRLSDYTERRAAFDLSKFTERLMKCDELLRELEEKKLTEDDLGEFKRKYSTLDGELSLMPVGARDVDIGDYVGEIYYFLDVNKTSGRNFLTVSDLRPVFYENEKKRRRTPSVCPWDLAVPLKSVMKNSLVLYNAKISDDKLSTSAETKVMNKSKVSLNSPEVYDLIKDDFREIAAALDEAGDIETDRIFFVRPTACLSQRYDKYDQQFIMEIEDVNGCRINIKAKFRAETKSFIETLEKIGKRMLSDKDTCFTLLAVAGIEDGELTLFPIEIYDFIVPFECSGYTLPEKYEGAAAYAGYAETLLNLFSKLREMMSAILHCGLRSEIRDEDKLVKYANNCGMKGLAELAGKVIEGASAFRHSTGGDAREMLLSMEKLSAYIKTGEQRLQTISALSRMQPDDIRELDQ